MASSNKPRGAEHLVCGWPLLLVAVGGMLGGLFGGVAYGINVKIFTSNASKGQKYLFSILVGIGACLLYLLAAVMLVVALS